MSHLTRGLTSFPSSHSSLRLSWDTIAAQYIKDSLLLLLRFLHLRFHFTSLHLISFCLNIACISTHARGNSMKLC
jgi:hypothetical protein